MYQGMVLGKFPFGEQIHRYTGNGSFLGSNSRGCGLLYLRWKIFYVQQKYWSGNQTEWKRPDLRRHNDLQGTNSDAKSRRRRGRNRGRMPGAIERGGHGRIRTYNLLIWNQPLYQLELHTLNHSRNLRAKIWLCDSASEPVTALSPTFIFKEGRTCFIPSLKNIMQIVNPKYRKRCPLLWFVLLP